MRPRPQRDFERELRRAARRLEQSHQQRDATIVQAAAAGLSYRAIAEAVGLSKQRIEQILREARKLDTVRQVN